MFTHVAHNQQPNHFSRSVQYSNQDLYKCPPFIPPWPNVVHNQRHCTTTRAGNYQRKLQKSSQHAYPLQSSISLSRQELRANERSSKSEVSEHMLRRKTPNGTLAAGYDGRPVEWAARPHAVKHFLMPVSRTTGGTTYHPQSSPNDQNQAARDNERESLARAEATDISCTENTIPLGERRLGFPSAIGLDSVLNQGPVPHQCGNMSVDQPIPTVLQPMWPPCAGPTSLNDPGPYGSYWPNDAFVPYRPSPLRDTRHQDAMREVPIIGTSQVHFTANSHGEWNPPPNRLPSSYTMASKFAGSVELPQNYPAAEVENPTRKKNSSCSQEECTHQYLQIPLAYRGKRSSLRGVSEHLISTGRGSLGMAASDRSEISQSPFQKMNFHASHTQFKDKVLIWAHSAYISLTSLHRSRRNASTSHHVDRQPKSAIYLRPLRQLSSDPSRHYASINQKSENVQYRMGRSNNLDTPAECNEQWQSFPTPQSKLIDDRLVPNQSLLSSPSSCQNRNFRQTWQSSEFQNPVPYPTLPSIPHIQSIPIVPPLFQYQHEESPSNAAATALDMLERLCQESGWEWLDGMLLGGCLAYGLGEHSKAMNWYLKVLSCDPDNVEAMSNLAATLLSLNRRDEAEKHWIHSIKLRPSFFEAIEHLVGLLCEDHRGKEAIKIIEYVEQALRIDSSTNTFSLTEANTETAGGDGLSPSRSLSERSDYEISDRESLEDRKYPSQSLTTSRFGSSGYKIPSSDNGRMLALIHGKGNMLYALGDNAGAAKAFEDAILLGTGKRHLGIRGLIMRVLAVFSDRENADGAYSCRNRAAEEPILLPPELALETSQLVFPSQGRLPGINGVSNCMAKRAAVSIVSNSLLSLAKIYQDGMSSSGATANGPRATSGVQEILAMYYLSLSLQPSPSTANNVGILLASVQQSTSSRASMGLGRSQALQIPGIVPGSGIALALAYYNYGLNLDPRHAHLYTNLGSLFKDIGQLNAAIKMYEKAVDCDGNFDIALANLANAVKDQGRISDAITYYRRAVLSSPDFAEAVCGLANALNSVCSWSGRGGIRYSSERRDRWHVDEEGMLYDGRTTHFVNSGWIERVVSIVEKQLHDGEGWGKGVLHSIDMEALLKQFDSIYTDRDLRNENLILMRRALESWADNPWEGAKVVRLVERATKRLGWQWYQDRLSESKALSTLDLTRPQLPAALAIPSAPTVLPFHTFTCPLSARQIRRISQRNGLRISCSTLRAPWLPMRIYEPPLAPSPQLNVGYISSDFNNHPLAHLMQSVFGLHNKAKVTAFCYATTAGDGSVHRQQIEREAPKFYDASLWSIDRLVNQVVEDGIHILVNLNGYTRGARNEVFAARPAPIQMSFMGFAGTLGAEWCDYLLADEIAVPRRTLRPWRVNVDLLDQTKDENDENNSGDWIYGENIIFTRDTFFCCDHRQSAPDSQEVQLNWADEQKRRWRMRRELFPDLTDDKIILGNFNQLYKIEPTTFRTWLRILSRVPNAVLWLLRFPDLGEKNLRQTALLWVGSEVASRIIFTDVAPKHQHISRARICDLFLDTPECNAHTTAADVLWSGTPLLTLPRYEYKMCSRIAASILRGALPKTAEGNCAMKDLVVHDDDEYEERAVELALGLVYPIQAGMQGRGQGRLMDLRKLLYESRWDSALFDTRRWVRDLELAYWKAWRRWVKGKGGDIWL